MSICTAGATALSTGGVRRELPGRSARGHGVASPCGSLFNVSARQFGLAIIGMFPTVVLDLLVVLDRHFGGIGSNSRAGLSS